MRVAFVSHHAPRPQGSASGRMLHALVEAMRVEGHDATVVCWGEEPPDLPSWAAWASLPGESRLRTKARGLWRPRSDSVRLPVALPGDAVAVADDTISFAAARRHPRLVVNVHNSLALDHAALGARGAADLQDVRAERRVVRAAPALWVSSDRVQQHFGRGVVVPYTLPLPAEAVPCLDRPVVGMIADWRWPPNQVALQGLLQVWPEIRAAVPAAELLLAGRGDPRVAASDGVRVVGEVPTTTDLLGQVAVLAFPCPPTSGAKMKSFDAVAHGVALVTTPAGAEGMPDGAGVVVPGLGEGFVQEVVRLLTDAQARAEQAARGRALLQEHHAPAVAARARLALLAPG